MNGHGATTTIGDFPDQDFLAVRIHVHSYIPVKVLGDFFGQYAHVFEIGRPDHLARVQGCFDLKSQFSQLSVKNNTTLLWFFMIVDLNDGISAFIAVKFVIIILSYWSSFAQKLAYFFQEKSCLITVHISIFIL